MSSLFALMGQALRNLLIVVDDVVVLAKPALAQFDDIVALAKPAVGQSSGVVIDDAAVGAGMIGKSAIEQHREYVVWSKICAGSMVNKTILSGLFLLLAHVAPIVPQFLLGLGGAYLSYEGAHKVYGVLRHRGVHTASAPEADDDSGFNAILGTWITRKGPLGALARFIGVDERERTVVADLLTLDTILATEILLVAMGSMSAQSTTDMAVTMGVVSLATTMLVYVPILGIMRSDNLAAWLEGDKGQGPLPQAGRALRHAIPKFLRLLAVVGTVAMLEVGGGILAHKIPSALSVVAEGVGARAHQLVGAVEHALGTIPVVGHFLAAMLFGLVGGLLVFVLLAFVSFLKGKIGQHANKSTQQ